MTTAEITIGENKVSTTLKNLNVITFGLNQNKYLGILIFFNCLVLLCALIFTGGKDKSKFKFSLIFLLLLINSFFCFAFFYLIPKLTKDIKHGINIMEGISEGEDLKKFLNGVIKFMWMRKGVTLIVFLCIFLIIIYTAVSMPKEYSSYNKNMTSIKRAITSDWKNLRILSYQFLILILTSSIIGHEAFGYKYDEFRNELLSLRYNFVMIFNKFLIEPKPNIKSLIYLYHRFAIFVFYNVVLTGFLATFYFHSCTKRELWFQKVKDIFVLPKASDFNFDVKIKATFEEILSFKVFLKSFESYREHIKMNQMEDEDTCNYFVETFTQSKQGLNKITFNGDQYVYFERIKRFLLCIVFLRVKISSYNSKIKLLEEQKERIIKQNVNKREYLILLQKKLKETTEEIERFRSKNKILDLIDSNNEVEDNEDKPFTNTIKIKKYDTKQLETFVTNPNPRKVVVDEEQKERIIKQNDDRNSLESIRSYGSSKENEFIKESIENKGNKEGGDKKVGKDSRSNSSVGSRNISINTDRERGDKGKDKDEGKEENKKNEEANEDKENENNMVNEPSRSNDEVKVEDSQDQSEANNECSAGKQSDGSESKTQSRLMLKRPEKRQESIDVGIFKKRILKDFEEDL